MNETFGRYTVVGQLGRGAMGVVYLATDPMLNRQVAVKTVDLGVDDPQEQQFLRERLLRDARAAAVLKHPNIVAIYDVFEDGNRAFLVMEYVEGDSLAARLKSSPLPDATNILKVMRQAADALDYTHARGVIHRDIKPANIMIDNTGTTKIMDFGIARITDSRTCTPTGMVMGTVEYMAPEQILGETTDGRADQFALAVVAYQMMTGSTLWGPNSVATLTYKIVNESPPPPSTRNAMLPRGLDIVLAKALAKKASDRFASCSEFVGALAQAFSDAPTAPLPPPTAAMMVPHAGQTTVAMTGSAAVAGPARSRAPIAIAALAVVLLGGALAAVILKPWNRSAKPPESAVASTTAPPATAPPTPDVAVEPPAKTNTKVKSEPAKVEPTKVDSSKVEPPKVAKSDVAKVEPPKVEPPKVEPPKPDPPKPEPAKTVPPKVVADVPDPVDEVETAPTPEPKGGGSTPFAIALHAGQQQVKENNYAGALQSYSRALQLRPEAAQAYFGRGSVYQHMEQFDMAKQDFSQALRFDPKMAQAHTGIGQCLVHQKQDPAALVEFQKAIEINPNAYLALLGRGNVYMRRKQYRLALADFDKVVNVSPRFATGYQARAKAREAIGDLAGADADRQIEAKLHKQ